MITIHYKLFQELTAQIDIKPRLKRDLKFVVSTAKLQDKWASYELIPITDRTGDKGVLLLQPKDELYVVQYELSRRIVDTNTGRDRAIICDFCFSWNLVRMRRVLRFLMLKVDIRRVFYVAAI